MRFVVSLSLVLLCLLSASCGHKPRGRRMMTHEDSVKRAMALAEEAHLTEMETVRESLEGPAGMTGPGDVSRGERISTDRLDEATAAVIRLFNKHNEKVALAMRDSTTPFGVLMSRFSVQDTLHKYMSATYSNDGHLLTFHSEVTQDDRHKLDFDFYFDRSKLIYYRERHAYTSDDDEQDMVTDDSYYMEGDRVQFSYRDEGHAPHRSEHMDVISLSRYALHGDILVHVSHAFDSFQRDYTSLLAQPLEMMVYTPATRITMPEIPADKKPASGKGFSF